MDWSSSGRRASGGAVTQPYRVGPKRLDQLLFHSMAGPEVKFFRGLVVFVDRSGPTQYVWVTAPPDARRRLELQSKSQTS